MSTLFVFVLFVRNSALLRHTIRPFRKHYAYVVDDLKTYTFGQNPKRSKTIFPRRFNIIIVTRMSLDRKIIANVSSNNLSTYFRNTHIALIFHIYRTVRKQINVILMFSFRRRYRPVEPRLCFIIFNHIFSPYLSFIVCPSEEEKNRSLPSPRLPHASRVYNTSVTVTILYQPILSPLPNSIKKMNVFFFNI